MTVRKIGNPRIYRVEARDAAAAELAAAALDKKAGFKVRVNTRIEPLGKEKTHFRVTFQ